MTYTTGTRVEVETLNDRNVMAFLPGTVEAVVLQESGHSDVSVRTDSGTLKVVRVGKRGGGRQIRPL
jgi:archaellum component FlaG (FlaF/FlaG flagellin family)